MANSKTGELNTILDAVRRTEGFRVYRKNGRDVVWGPLYTEDGTPARDANGQPKTGELSVPNNPKDWRATRNLESDLRRKFGWTRKQAVESQEAARAKRMARTRPSDHGEQPEEIDQSVHTESVPNEHGEKEPAVSNSSVPQSRFQAAAASAAVQQPAPEITRANGTAKPGNPSSADSATGPNTWDTYETITPEIAQQYLDLRPPTEGYVYRQRPLSAETIRNYERQMKGGEWVNNHPQPLIFDWNGYLMDGQQRMSAVVKSEVTIVAKVTHNADPKLFFSLDQGKRRTAGDMVYSAGRDKYASHAAEAVRVLWSFDSSPTTFAKDGVIKLTPKETVEIEREFYQDLTDDSLKLGRRIRARKPRVAIGGAAVSAVHYMILRAWPGAPADEFFDEVITGGALPANSKQPGMTLHRYLTGTRASNMSRLPITPQQDVAMLLRFWEARCKGEVLARPQPRELINMRAEPYVPPEVKKLMRSPQPA